MLCKESRKVLTFAVWLPPSYMDCYLIGTFRLDYDLYEIEYEFEFQTSDISRVLALHVGV